MGNAYQLELWSNIYFMLGSSAAGLVGLLFIVTSLHLDKIKNNPVLRRRANQRTLYLFLLLIEAVLVLMPQPLQALGVELIVINLFGLGFPLSNVSIYDFKSRNSGNSDDWAIMRAIRYILAFLVGIAGGVTLIRQSVWGMYMVTASFVALLILVALNAWTIMFSRD
jgi:energy-converting hydrogenase Eha subunit A